MIEEGKGKGMGKREGKAINNLQHTGRVLEIWFLLVQLQLTDKDLHSVLFIIHLARRLVGVQRGQ